MKLLSFVILFLVAVLFAGCNSKTHKHAERLQASASHTKEPAEPYVRPCYLSRSRTFQISKDGAKIDLYNCRFPDVLDFVFVTTGEEFKFYHILDSPETAKKYYHNEVLRRQLYEQPKWCEKSRKLEKPVLNFNTDKVPYLTQCDEHIVIENFFLWRRNPKAVEFQKMFDEERNKL